MFSATSAGGFGPIIVDPHIWVDTAPLDALTLLADSVTRVDDSSAIQDIEAVFFATEGYEVRAESMEEFEENIEPMAAERMLGRHPRAVEVRIIAGIHLDSGVTVWKRQRGGEMERDEGVLGGVPEGLTRLMSAFALIKERE